MTDTSESRLYRPISRLLEEKGLSVWEEATICAGDEGTRTADHVAWRWSGKEIDAMAVEVKAGPATVALAQAVAYGVGFRRVYLAADEALPEMGYVAKALAQLGLGYIRASARKAAIELESSGSVLVSPAVQDENLARIRLKHLWNRTVVGERTLFLPPGDRRGPVWGVTRSTREWQIAALLYPGSSDTWLSLVAESKGLGVRVATRTTAEEFSAAATALGTDQVEIHLQRREHKFQPRYQHVAKWQPSEGMPALRRLLSLAGNIKGASVGPWFEIRTNLWPHSTHLTEARARKNLRAAVDRMRRVQSNLNAVVGR